MSVDGDGDTPQETHSCSDHEERDGYEVRMQEMEARANIPSHGQSLKDFLPDVIRRGQDSQSPARRPCWGSTENTLGRSRIVGALKQQWPDHELRENGGDRNETGSKDVRVRPRRDR